MLPFRQNVSLKNLNTFGVEADAKYFSTFKNEDELGNLTGILPQPVSLLILGSGSNILFTSDYEGLVLKNEVHGIRLITETKEEVLLEVGGGEIWTNLVETAIHNGWSGIENLNLIPGTVGAAPVQNIGAYGVELREVLVSLKAFDLQTGRIQVFENEMCNFGYRTSLFKTTGKGRYVILSVRIRLRKRFQPNITYAPLRALFDGMDESMITLREVGEAVRQIRMSKLPDPAITGNAGSFFKNPVISNEKLDILRSKYPGIPSYPFGGAESKVAAGWLIEQCGWKGKRIGSAGVHDRQALVLVNHGGATGKEIAELAGQIRESVKDTFDIELDTEVTVL